MSGWGYFFLILILLLIFIPLGWIAYTRLRAHRAGLPPPPLSSYNPFSANRSADSGPNSRIYPAPTGALDWVKNKFASMTGGRGRTGGGAYEQPLGGGARRGLDPDEAWDSRVGAEADAYGAGGYYEEQELGLHPPPAGTGYAGARGGHGGGVLPDYGDEHAPRGRSLSRDLRDDGFIGGGKQGLDQRYDEEVHGAGHEDPFGDEAERSELRGVSPRPAAEEGLGVKGKKSGGKDGPDSPTERRSMFREAV